MEQSAEYLQMLLTLVKQGLGIMTNIRNEYLEARILASIRSLFFEKGVVIDEADMNLTMFIVDYTIWRYKSVNSSGAMPVDLRVRMNNVLVKYTGGGDP